MKETFLTSETDLITGEKTYWETYQDDDGLWWKNQLKVPDIFIKKIMEQDTRKHLHELLDKMLDNKEPIGNYNHAELVGGNWVIQSYKLTIEKIERNFTD